MKAAAVVVCLLLSCCAYSQSQAPASPGQGGEQAGVPGIVSDQPLNVDPAKAADIHRLIELTGGKQLAVQMIDQMSRSLKPLMTNSLPPGEYREKLVDLFYAKFQSKLDIGKFEEMAVPIYDKYLSREEVKGLIEFYQTPLGQKTLKVLPRLMTEMQAAGEKWGGELGRTSMQEVLAENPDLARALETAAKAAQPH